MAKRYAVTITENGRPQYLLPLLAELLEARTYAAEPWSLVIRCEPEASYSRSLAEAHYGEWLRDAFDEYSFTRNEVPRGVRENPFELLRDTFAAGYAGVLYLENDLTISPDVLRLAEWYFANRDRWQFSGHQRADRGPCLHPDCTDIALCLFNRKGQAYAGKCPGAEQCVSVSHKFSALGFAITADQWAAYFAPHWHALETGWDWSIQQYINDAGPMRPVVVPYLSRTNHTGREGGTHCPPELHDRMFGQLDRYRDDPPTGYVLAYPPPPID